jgi:hypothetical protein
MLIDFCERNGLMVQETKKKTVHMEGTWRLESTSVGLHPCEASIEKQCEGKVCNVVLEKDGEDQLDRSCEK